MAKSQRKVTDVVENLVIAKARDPLYVVLNLGANMHLEKSADFVAKLDQRAVVDK
jgi:CO dehydrogenase/acetyl-CoA synthase epsilon subunit